jgi:transposase
MNGNKQRRFTDEFKREAVRLTMTIRARAGGFARGPHEDVSKELARLRKENEILRQEREILKKAKAFFAKEGSR